MPLHITPSPCHVIDHQDTVREAISALQREKSCYVLVLNSAEEVVGILTDRDVLNQFFALATSDLNKPVTSIMTSPVLMVRTDEMHNAASLMAQRNIRHVPVYDLVDERKKLVGVVTLQALARENLLREAERSLSKTQRPPEGRTASLNPTRPEPQGRGRLGRIAVVASDGSTYRSISGLVETHAERVACLGPGDLAHPELVRACLREHAAIILDLDHFPTDLWKSLVHSWNQGFRTRQLLIVFSRNTLAPHVQGVLQQISRAGSGSLRLFAKPLDLMGLHLALQSAAENWSPDRPGADEPPDCNETAHRRE